MKKATNLLLLSFAALFIIAAASCSKGGGASNTTITVQNISGTYKLTDVTISLPPAPPLSIYDSVPACRRDDLIKLNPDLSAIFIDAGTACVPPGNDTATWSLNGNIISIDTLSGIITQFTGAKLLISTPITYMGISVTSTETLTRQ